MEKRIYKKPQTGIYFPIYPNFCIVGESRIDNGDGEKIDIVPGSEGEGDWNEWHYSNGSKFWDAD